MPDPRIDGAPTAAPRNSPRLNRGDMGWALGATVGLHALALWWLSPEAGLRPPAARASGPSPILALRAVPPVNNTAAGSMAIAVPTAEPAQAAAPPPRSARPQVSAPPPPPAMTPMTEPPPGAAPLDAAAIAAASLAQPAAVSARQPPPSAAPPAAADSRPRDSGLSVGQEAVAETAAQTSAPLPPPPLYPTQMAPSFTRHYAVRRGGVAGSGELILEVGAGRYALELRSSAMGVDLIGLTSRGQIDANGFAPERFVDRRRGRDRLAANFDPAARHITYSGATATQPLHPGTQDRLSWMLQLAAIVQAQPQRFEPGQRIVMAVSGARADLDLWVFEVVDRGPVVLPSGTVAQALHLTRAPRRPYDTQAEIWLDAAQHHLPVRARLTVLPGGHTLELAWTGG